MTPCRVLRAGTARERDFGLASIGDGRHARRWEFTPGRKRKVDDFFYGCDTALAVLGESTIRRFLHFLTTSGRVACWVRPAC